ncbi:MAG: DNA-processing protein DprA [Candidatus Dormibacteria bacterium]
MDLPAGWWECRPSDATYPRLLGAITTPPSLAVRGRLEAATPMVAIVGARRCSTYGEELAYDIAYELAGMGVTVVSGLARGIDGAAHRGALDGGGATVAVMGTGPDAVYPPEHRELADRISAAGALVTQFPVGMQPLPHNFPRRNQTISGLCVGVLVVEARRKSGAMLTAGAAADQGRVVMATPGSVRNPASRGCHDLLRDGARLVTNAGEVMAETSTEPLFRMLVSPLSEPGRQRFGDCRDGVLLALETGCMTLDELVAEVNLPSPEVVTAVARLRLDGELRLRDGAYGLATTR